MKKPERIQLNARVERRWKKQVVRDAMELEKTKEIVVNAILRFVFTTMTREQRSKLYQETPYESLRTA